MYISGLTEIVKVLHEVADDAEVALDDHWDVKDRVRHEEFGLVNVFALQCVQSFEGVILAADLDDYNISPRV